MPLLSIAEWNVLSTAGLVYTEANTAMLNVLLKMFPSTPLLLRIRNIARLVVRDASGGDHSFTRDAVELRPGGVKETIRLRGPGDLLVISSSATFLRDSQVCQSTNPAASPYIISAIVYVTVL